MGDLIDRQVAIAQFYKHPNVNWTTLDVMNELKSLTTADVVEVKHGKWVKMWHSCFKQELPCCSVCGNFLAMRWNYCPNCGSRNEVEE